MITYTVEAETKRQGKIVHSGLTARRSLKMYRELCSVALKEDGDTVRRFSVGDDPAKKQQSYRSNFLVGDRK